MRITARRGTARLVATIVVTLAVAAACGGTPPSGEPAATPAATPFITPDPHLPDPATADQVFLALGAAGIKMTANNAAAGPAEGPLVKRINATLLGWPLTVTQYRTTAALQEVTAWAPGEAPGQGEPPVAIAGLNILVQWGATTGAQPQDPSGPQIQGLIDLASAMDVLLSPLAARSVVTIPGVVTVAPAPSAAPASSAGPSGEASPAG
ncbi:MAG: hypothetical protein ABIP77_04750 [Candidatus Limnocylindrales bacterium]